MANERPKDLGLTHEPAGPSEVDRLRAQLAKEQAKNEDLSQKLSKAEELGSNGPRGPREISTTTTKEPMWLFEVSVGNHPAIPKMKIKAVDESEAIRLFVLKSNHEDGKPLDSTRCRFNVVCLDPKRVEGIRKRYEAVPGPMIPQLT